MTRKAGMINLSVYHVDFLRLRTKASESVFVLKSMSIARQDAASRVRSPSEGRGKSSMYAQAYNPWIMPALLRNLRFGARMLAKNPGFTFATAPALALRTAPNTAIFTVTNALLLRPFPYHEPKQLVSVAAKDKTTDRGGTLLRYE